MIHKIHEVDHDFLNKEGFLRAIRHFLSSRNIFPNNRALLACKT